MAGRRSGYTWRVAGRFWCRRQQLHGQPAVREPDRRCRGAGLRQRRPTRLRRRLPSAEQIRRLPRRQPRASHRQRQSCIPDRGRWDDSQQSPAIDRGAASYSYALEPAPNGGYINLGNSRQHRASLGEPQRLYPGIDADGRNDRAGKHQRYGDLAVVRLHRQRRDRLFGGWWFHLRHDRDQRGQQRLLRLGSALVAGGRFELCDQDHIGVGQHGLRRLAGVHRIRPHQRLLHLADGQRPDEQRAFGKQPEGIHPGPVERLYTGRGRPSSMPPPAPTRSPRIST